jgi:hypothetical protein
LPEMTPDPDALGKLSRFFGLVTAPTSVDRRPVRVVFYGQSITQQDWWHLTARGVQEAYPDIPFSFENLSISGFQAHALARTGEADLVPLQPDLIIVQAYGDEPGMDALLTLIRQRTTADVLLMSDHMYLWTDPIEETDPARIREDDFWPYRNYVVLPRLAKKHGVCLAEVRRFWREYLNRNSVSYLTLLGEDTVHLGKDGNALMTAIVSAYLGAASHQPRLDPWGSPRARRAQIDHELDWRGNKLTFDFTGSSLQISAGPDTNVVIEVRIDGRLPSEHPEIYGFTRSSMCIGREWPGISFVGSQASLLEEDWTLTLHEMSSLGEHFTYSVEGSRTGPDGKGTNDTTFVSQSGRVILEQRDLNLGLAVLFSGQLPPPGFQVQWRSVCRGVDRFVPGALPVQLGERTLNAAVGLADGHHVVELVAIEGTPGGIYEVRAYSPENRANLETLYPTGAPLLDRLTIRRVGATNELYWPLSMLTRRIEFSPAGVPPNWQTVGTDAGIVHGFWMIKHVPQVDSGVYRLHLTSIP